jgi:hypothetical protein
MKFPSLLVALAGLALVAAATDPNLIPNWNFADATPLNHYRFQYPGQEQYVTNGKFVSQKVMLGKKCAELDLPAGVAETQGAKIETALVPIEPGATYHVEVACLQWDYTAKIHAEVFAPDPRSDVVREDTESKGRRITIFRIPAGDGHPALVMCYRAQLPDPSGDHKKWVKTEREFTVPMEVTVAKEKVKPMYASIKVVVIGGHAAGKSYYSDFKLVKTKAPGAVAAPKDGIGVIR